MYNDLSAIGCDHAQLDHVFDMGGMGYSCFMENYPLIPNDVRDPIGLENIKSQFLMPCD